MERYKERLEQDILTVQVVYLEGVRGDDLWPSNR